MLKKVSILANYVFLIFLLSACAGVGGREGKILAQYIVDTSVGTLERFYAHEESYPEFRNHLQNAKAVMIFPSVTAAGLFVGSDAGNGLLIRRLDDGSWGYPAFYMLASGSLGIQFGVQNAEHIMLVKTDKGLSSIIEDQFHIGPDAKVSFGFIGAGIEGYSTTNANFDIIGFSNTLLGVYGGVNIKGGGIIRRVDLNESWYGPHVTPEEIVLKNRYAYPGANLLRSTLHSMVN